MQQQHEMHDQLAIPFTHPWDCLYYRH